MLGAIIGDIAGSRFEWNNLRSKEFELLTDECKPTDDTYMSLAIARAVLESGKDPARLETLAVRYMRDYGRRYPDGCYGGRFGGWLYAADPQPYNSLGNGSAMRVSACGFAAESLDEAKSLARASAVVTHNHPEGIKGAESVAAAIYLARTGADLSAIRDYVRRNYYRIDFTLDEIRDSYRFDETCPGSVPQAFEAFFESTDFTDAIRSAISIGGDSDTIAAITGGMAEAFYGIPADLRARAVTFLDGPLRKTLEDFEAAYP